MLKHQTLRTSKLQNDESRGYGTPLRTPLNYPIKHWMDPRMVLRRSPSLGKWSGHNAETPEGRSCEVMRIVDLGILQDIP
jgi:hypothetical protein